MTVNASEMSFSIRSVAASFDVLAEDCRPRCGALVLAVDPESCDSPAIDNNKMIKSAADVEKRRVTNPKSPLDY